METLDNEMLAITVEGQSANLVEPVSGYDRFLVKDGMLYFNVHDEVHELEKVYSIIEVYSVFELKCDN